MPAVREQRHHFVRSGAVREPLRLVRKTDYEHVADVPVLRFSSPWPWVFALAISCAMWVGIGWVIWKII